MILQFRIHKGVQPFIFRVLFGHLKIHAILIVNIFGFFGGIKHKVITIFFLICFQIIIQFFNIFRVACMLDFFFCPVNDKGVAGHCSCCLYRTFHAAVNIAYYISGSHICGLFYISTGILKTGYSKHDGTGCKSNHNNQTNKYDLPGGI